MPIVSIAAEAHRAGAPAGVWHARLDRRAVRKGVRDGEPADAVRPVPWTGLVRPPDRLVWRNAPSARAYVFTVQVCGTISTCRSDVPELPWPAEARIEPGEAVVWSVRPAASDGPLTGGAWWIVRPADLARFRAACAAIRSTEDRTWRAVGVALAAAECGLYEDALALFDDLLSRRMSRGQESIARRARLSVLGEVVRAVPDEVREIVTPWFRSEIEVEERALALCLCPAAQQGRAPSGRGAEVSARSGAPGSLSVPRLGALSR